MSSFRLHLDADTSIKALYLAISSNSHDITRTPNEWIAKDASDEMQLLKATAQGRCIFTFNVKDFLTLAKQYPDHHGIILAAQSRWYLSDLIKALTNVFTKTHSEDWIGQVRWLNQYRQ